MGSAFHQLHHKKSLREIDIPPRKLLGRRNSSSPETGDMFSDETLLRRFLPFNGDDDEDAGDPYSSDHFRMYEFKVRKCTRSRSHDWTDCPFAHPGEKARRRDPRRHHYSGAVCPEFRRGSCTKGDGCEFAHGVFECWLHPARYRTEACKDGKNCRRKICFFAHTPRQLRILPENSSPVNSPAPVSDRSSKHCCIHCVHCHSMIASPTSTLLDMSQLSPPVSPPPSPVKTHRQLSGFSPISRFSDRLKQFNSGVLSYKDALTELMTSMEAMSVNEVSPNRINSRNRHPWVNVNFNGDDQIQTQFVLSPSTPNSSGFRDNFAVGSSRKSFIDENGMVCPDLGWVNDLLT